MSAPYVFIEVIDGPAKGTTHRCKKHKNTVGRTARSTFCVKDSSVSEKHAEIRYEEERWVLVDTTSSNGTQVNGCQCNPNVAYPLNDGDTVRLGDNSICRVEVLALPDNETSVEQYLTNECERMVTQVKRRAETLTNNLRSEIDTALEDIKNKLE